MTTEDERPIIAARILLIAYALALTIRGTASLQSALLLTALALLLWQRRHRLAESWREARWVLGPLLLFSIWIILICGFWREPPLRAWDPNSWDMRQPWFSLNQWRRDVAQPGLALLCGFWAFRDSRWKRALFLAQGVLILMLTIQCLKQFYHGELIVEGPMQPGINYWFKGTLFVRGFSRDNTFFSYVLFLLTPGICWLVLENRVRWRDWFTWKNGCRLAIAVVLLYLIFLNKRRGTWLAVYLELLMIVAWMGRRALAVFILATVLMGIAAFQVRPLWFKRDYDTGRQSPEAASRFEIARAYPELIREHPWVGVGFGKDTVVKNYWHRIFQHTHNFPLNVLLEVGLPGLLLWLGALTAYGRRLWGGCAEGWTARIGLAFLTGFLVRNLSDDVWIASNAELFWFQLGILLPARTRTDA